MKSYFDYINDPYFLKWIFLPDELTATYWENYLRNHSNERNQILAVKEELSTLKLKNDELSEDEKKALLRSILQKQNTRPGLMGVSRKLMPLLKYAAIAILFLAIGNIIMYSYLSENFNDLSLSELKYTLPEEKPILILSDGSHVKLEKNSTVKYDNNKKLFIDDQLVNTNTEQLKSAIPNQAIIPSGSRTVLTLSDNTKVFLNAGSKLVYPSEFKGDKREVLLSGEAFFEVSKNKNKPFIVKTSSLAIKVLGTKFNISAYSEDIDIKTVLVEGAVAVRKNDAGIFDQGIYMKPNQLVSFNKKSEVFSTREADTEIYTLWKDGMLKFQDEELKNIIHKLERFYDLHILLKDSQKGILKLSGKLNLSEDKYEVFEYLKALTNMNLEEINEKYFILK